MAILIIYIQCAFSEDVCPLKKTEPAGRDDDVNIATHRADRAIAILNLEGRRQVHLEPHCAAMASALMCRELAHLAALPNPYRWETVDPRVGALQLSGEGVQ